MLASAHSSPKFASAEILGRKDSLSPEGNIWSAGSLFSPKYYEQDISSILKSPPLSDLSNYYKNFNVVHEDSPRTKWGNTSAFVQGNVIMNMLGTSGPGKHSSCQELGQWNRSNAQDSLRDLSNELEQLRLSNEPKNIVINSKHPALAYSNPTISCRGPSPTCRVTDEQRERLRAEQRLYDKVKTVLCTQYMKIGRCEYGNRCRFAHGYGELRLRKVPANYKTVLCQNFERDGFCRYGKRCQFIHRTPSQCDMDENNSFCASFD